MEKECNKSGKTSRWDSSFDCSLRALVGLNKNITKLVVIAYNSGAAKILLRGATQNQILAIAYPKVKQHVFWFIFIRSMEVKWKHVYNACDKINY